MRKRYSKCHRWERGTDGRKAYKRFHEKDGNGAEIKEWRIWAGDKYKEPCGQKESTNKSPEGQGAGQTEEQCKEGHSKKQRKSSKVQSPVTKPGIS